MASLAPSHEIKFFEEHEEVHSVVSGFWSLETIQTYFDAVNDACLPLVKARKPIFALVDFTGFVTQDRAVGDAIRDHLLQAQKFGMRRLAIIGASPLVKMQYKRLSEGVTVEYFDSQSEGQRWLRDR